MGGLFNGQASKALVAVLTAVASALPVYYGTAKWVPVVVMAIGAVMVYLVPNATPLEQDLGKHEAPPRM